MKVFNILFLFIAMAGNSQNAIDDSLVVRFIDLYKPASDYEIWIQREPYKYSDLELQSTGRIITAINEYFDEKKLKEIDSVNLQKSLVLQMKSAIETGDQFDYKIRNVRYFRSEKCNDIYNYNKNLTEKLLSDPKVKADKSEGVFKTQFNKRAKHILRLSRPMVIDKNYYIIYYEFGHKSLDFSGGYKLFFFDGMQFKELATLCGWTS